MRTRWRGRASRLRRPPRGGAPAYDVHSVAGAFPAIHHDSVGREVQGFWIESQGLTPRVAFFMAGLARPAPGRYPIGLAAERRVAASLGLSCNRFCAAYVAIGAAGDELVVTRSTPWAVSGTFRFTAAGNGILGARREDTLVVEGHFDAPCGRRDC